MANYVNPEEFRVEILLSKEKDELTPKAVEMLQLMAEPTPKSRDKRAPSLSFFRDTDRVYLSLGQTNLPLS